MAKTLHRLITSLAAAVAAIALMTVAPASADTSDTGVSPYIVGGSRVSTSTYPWVVYLTTSTGSQFCGGTLVRANKVVTAAHCVSGRTASSTRVVHGRDDKQSTAGRVVTVSRIWVHPSYRTASSGYDVAVLTLGTSISSTYLPLATPSDTALYAAGTSARIYGWGTTCSGCSASRYLLGATVPVTSDATCRTAYSNYSPTSMVCAGYPNGGTDTCQGDSGGPLVAGGKLIGATSFGRGCALAGYPGVYARIASYYSTITAQL
ncbi:secreted trypsin-like serine protease [Saccharothrix ecbatanensis]|uniref:Secreted trypsin-like serine protease n=1 Tax=Saccharothrix ecbatanensis TaxID=1105145 RepID=A0A7W9M2R3_9PSEU|nr:serine protease [Saccharothrix ecbatanensis]MBB5805257.1 secreted trypsin-like serine protease [Saccharothrix ecbatanensis]